MEKTDQIISTLLAQINEESPQLSDLMTKGAALGIPLQQLKKVLFSECEKKDVQKKWSNWSTVTDREEVRLRLLAINSFEKIDPALVPFVLFYFRASDSVLYQTAAQIVGKHLTEQPEIQNYIAAYLRERKIDPARPVELNGQRNRRRLLILFAACYKYKGPQIELDGKSLTIAPPLDGISSGELSSKNRLDYSAIMLAGSLLTGMAQGLDEKVIKNLLKMPDTVSDRNIIRNWGLLLNESKLSESEKSIIIEEALSKTKYKYDEAETYSAKLHLLYKADEILRSAVFVLQGQTDKLLADADRTDLLQFYRIRLAHWSSREINPVEKIHSVHTGSKFLSQVTASSLTNRDQASLFVSMLQSVQNEQSWRLQTLEERVWKTFFLIDFSIFNHFVSTYEMRQLLSGLYAETEFSDNDRLRSMSPLSIIIRRLLHFEQSARGTITDGRLIHKVADEKLLLALLPSGINSELLPVFADAFEHQIRLLMKTDSSFNPDQYLYKITIREPHPNFYRFLTELVPERRYGSDESREESFRLKLEYLSADKSQINSGSESNKHFKISGFWSSVEKIRERLEQQLESDDLFSLLSHLQHEIDGTGQELISPTATLHDLLNIIHEGEEQWLRSGFPAYWNRSASVLNNRLQQLNRQFKSDIEKLKPETLTGVSEAGEAAQRIRETIREVEQIIAPSLGAKEAALFSGLKNRSGELLQDWIQLLTSADSEWHNYDEHKPGEQHNLWNTLFKTAAASQNSYTRKELLQISLNTVIQQRDSGRKKTWFLRYQFLVWAAQNPPSEAEEEIRYWQKLLTKLWSEMLHEAMDQKQEARVVQLVKAPELKQVRRTESVTPVLENVKTWCFDRYDLLHAFICNREINPEINFVTNRWKTLREYFGHFSQVWIALLVGVIMMFDFGDPWTELAEIGDVGGVIFTFVLGVGGTYLYVFADLRKKVNLVKSDPFQWASQFGRVGLFLGITLTFTVLVVLLFYYMFYNTDHVVHGVYAIWHIMAWTGFALFVGVFFGLIGKS